MPNRIIKETLLTSPNFNKLSVYAERHFYRVLLLADDYGCFEALPEVIKGKCYSLSKSITVKRIITWSEELGKNYILGYWMDSERIYAVFKNFDKHNVKYSVTDKGNPTRHRRKTPEPPKQLFASLCHLLPNPNPNPNPNPKKNSIQEPSAADAVLKKVYIDGFNIYQHLTRLTKELGFKKGFKFPDEVIIKVCNQYFKDKEKVKEKWSWFTKVFARESEKYFANQNIKTNKESKQDGFEAMKDIMAKFVKEA